MAEIFADHNESADISDSITALHLVESVDESTTISVVMVASHLVDGIGESVTIGDVFSWSVILRESSAESLVMADSLFNQAQFPRTINDLLFIYDTLKHGWGVTTEESLILTDSTSEVLGLMISDWLTLLDTQTNNWNGQDIINDTLNIYDISNKYFQISDSISDSLTLTDTNSFKLMLFVLESLGFTEVAAGMLSTTRTVNDGVVLADSAVHSWQMLIEEALSAIDAASVIAVFYKTVQSALSASDAASLGVTIGKSVSETLTLRETVTNQGTLYTAVYETLKMGVTVELAGDVYECYVLNTPSFQVSMYSGFDFNSYCVFENRAFGANGTGVYELTGATDAGATIHTGVIMNETDFGSRNQKRFRRGYLGISGTSPVMVLECEDGKRQVYSIDSNGKAVFQHEQKSRGWTLSIAEFDELDTIQLVPIILTR